ncbi:hypothetical protein Hypma_004836 [Hypsizygus marmoreus]|uniref:Prolyl 4-hydroxylase alpha subunit Fe(2+) 2OG dioxygenase domain-containing protein n=1 Tax=Hypsizygus marmoreus TaxID=39966 RepID=A0A369J685_HYPMA|nr:hypothetical protein Hypma_004836 [Hypsizygus marmoreus]
MPPTKLESVDALRAAITKKPPYCTGTIPLGLDGSILFYRNVDKTKTGCIDFSHPTQDSLKALEEACEPATCGVGQHNVVGEFHHKPRKMATSNFAPKFDVRDSLLVDRIHTQLMDGANERKLIKAELDELNVYGKGSFSKSHKDAPRSDTMFGSLVLLFPTAHEGGVLVLRRADEEWTFDCEEIFRQQEEPVIFYVAFYRDVDHEVTAVKSGYRVSLRYSLFFESGRSSLGHLPVDVAPVAPNEAALRDALSVVLNDPSVLPKGGYLGFGLSFKYPVTSGRSPTSLKAAVEWLKGSDAVIKRACDQLSLYTSLKAVYDDKTSDQIIMVDELIESNFEVAEGYGLLDLFLCSPYNGTFIRELGMKRSGYQEMVRGAPKVLWVTRLTAYNSFKEPFVAYEADPAYLHGALALMAKIGAFGSRATNQ